MEYTNSNKSLTPLDIRELIKNQFNFFVKYSSNETDENNKIIMNLLPFKDITEAIDFKRKMLHLGQYNFVYTPAITEIKNFNIEEPNYSFVLNIFPSVIENKNIAGDLILNEVVEKKRLKIIKRGML